MLTEYSSFRLDLLQYLLFHYGSLSHRFTGTILRKRRRFDRKYFERVAALDLGDGTPSTTCEVIDISQGGARLRPLLCSPKTLPEKFILLLTAGGQVQRRCCVVWRSTVELGVQFHEL
jgi:PilZ domain